MACSRLSREEMSSSASSAPAIAKPAPTMKARSNPFVSALATSWLPPASNPFVRLLATVARIARPSAPPTCWAVLISPDASPASFVRVPVIAAIVTVTNDSPSPTAASSDGPSTSAAYEPPTRTRENQASPVATNSSPAINVGLKPTRVTSLEATPAVTMIALASGR